MGEFVHVFVERETGKPPKDGMVQEMRAALERIRVKPEGVESKL